MLIFGWLNTMCIWSPRSRRPRIASQAVCRRRQCGLAAPGGFERVEDRVLLAAIMVTGTGDTNNTDGLVTFREALTSINNGASLNADVAVIGTYGVSDTITFNIPGAGVQTITPLSPLPTVVKPVNINGYSQPGSSQNTLATTDNSSASRVSSK